MWPLKEHSHQEDHPISHETNENLIGVCTPATHHRPRSRAGVTRRLFRGLHVSVLTGTMQHSATACGGMGTHLGVCRARAAKGPAGEQVETVPSTEKA